MWRGGRRFGWTASCNASCSCSCYTTIHEISIPGMLMNLKRVILPPETRLSSPRSGPYKVVNIAKLPLGRVGNGNLQGGSIPQPVVIHLTPSPPKYSFVHPSKITYRRRNWIVESTPQRGSSVPLGQESKSHAGFRWLSLRGLGLMRGKHGGGWWSL